jgi:hypothetical protein
VDLQTIDIPRAGARAAAADYARLAKRTTDPREKREFEDIARAYRSAARDDVALISLSATIRAGGTMPRTRVETVWLNGGATKKRTHYALPRLAVCTPHSAFCFTLGVQRDGSVEFIDSLGRDYRYRKGVVDVDAQLELPDGYAPGSRSSAGGETAAPGSRWCRSCRRSTGRRATRSGSGSCSGRSRTGSGRSCRRRPAIPRCCARSAETSTPSRRSGT